MSYSTLRAKRATFTFQVDKSSLKIPKMVQFVELAIKQHYQTGHFFKVDKISEKCQYFKFQMRHFCRLSYTVYQFEVSWQKIQMCRLTRDNLSGVILRYRMNSITFEFPARFVRRYLRRDLVWGNESLEVASDKDQDAT